MIAKRSDWTQVIAVADDALLTDGLRAVLNTDAGRTRFCTTALAVGICDDGLRLIVLKTMPYAMYLRTEHWRQTSRAAKERAEHRCQLCNCQGRLETHHRTYARRGCEEEMDLIVLCEKCHGKFHRDLARDEPEPPKVNDDAELAMLAKLIEQKRQQLGIPLDGSRPEPPRPPFQR